MNDSNRSSTAASSTESPSPALAAFIESWRASGAAERANFQLFLTQLCSHLDLPAPQPTSADPEQNHYVFEFDVTFQLGDGTTAPGRIDLYKRDSFVLEAKQGSDYQERLAKEESLLLSSDAPKKKAKKGTAVRGTREYDDAMIRARGQADRYARNLPAGHVWPPFLIVVDVGHSIELYSEFTRTGKTYIPFPDPQSHRIKLEDLAKPEIRERLKLVWTDLLSLDPTRKSAKVTRHLAERLAALAKLLEAAGHEPELVARFLMRSLFTMFAEDVELIPRDSFKGLLKSLWNEPENFQPMVEDLWQTMNKGGFSPILRQKLLKFNGGLFADSETLPLTPDMLALLIDAAHADWADVEPAIFGTLLERALDPVERHKLGAHYTPRAYVERLVMPTIIEPLREEWNAVYAAAVAEAKEGNLKEAQKDVWDFHGKLCETRVLDPACGSGNFLYVTLEHMKRLEGEVLNAFHDFGGDRKQVLLEVDPHQFLGIEINPRAAAIADLVLWIGYLQWHFRTRGRAQPAEPVIKNYQNIECRDAVLAWDRKEPLLDDNGHPVTRWDGRTTKRHPVTGEQVPDETCRLTVVRYDDPRPAAWPKCDYIVGNPPYIGVRRLRRTVSDEYVEALAETYPKVPETCDYVMYWWYKAAEMCLAGRSRQFGFITTNSITQAYSRPLLEKYLREGGGLKIVFAVRDHPWVDTAECARVRVAMTVAGSVSLATRPQLVTVESEFDLEDLKVSTVAVDRIGARLVPELSGTTVRPLKANKDICFQGVVPASDGFKLQESELSQMGLNPNKLPPTVRKYIIGKDIVRAATSKYIIDFTGHSVDEAREKWPGLYQHVLMRVRPEREAKRGPTKDSQEYADNRWLFAKTRPTMRGALRGLQRFIVVPYTAKHRPFVFVSADVLPDAMAYAIASDDACILGVLSSRIHISWSLARGGTLEDRPRYNSTQIFEPYPFPFLDKECAATLRDIGERLNNHRQDRIGRFPTLTVTDMYNVLEKLRSGEALTEKDKKIHEQGLVSVLKQIHDELDAAVFEAYGWPSNLTDEEILQRLVDLNAERAEEESRGIIRWLRPEFQQRQAGVQGTLELVEAEEDEADEQPKSAGKRKAKGPRGAALPHPGPLPAGEGVGRAAGKARAAKTAKVAWPGSRVERTRAVQDALSRAAGPVTVDELAKQFTRANKQQLGEILEALTALGLAKSIRGKYSA